MKNVHEFDGKVVINIPSFSAEEATKIIEDANFLQTMNFRAKSMVHSILDKNDPRNTDTLNNCNAEDLFISLLAKIKKDDHDIQRLLEEQLEDMSKLGPCAQGRVIRLWQLYQTL